MRKERNKIKLEVGSDARAKPTGLRIYPETIKVVSPYGSGFNDTNTTHFPLLSWKKRYVRDSLIL